MPPPQSTTRVTRHQLAKAQTGQYTLTDLFPSRDCSGMSQKLREIDFISLFGGRSAGPARARKGSLSSQGKEPYGHNNTDHYLYVAKDPWSKSLGETNNEAATAEELSKISTGGEVIPEQQAIKDNVFNQTLAKSPVKTLEEVERVYGSEGPVTPADDAGDDSFVNQITCRSPAKLVSRIEDSVEALDQLEEAIEALDQAALAERLVSPEKPRQKVQVKMDRDSRESRKQPAPAKPQALKPGYASMRVKPTAPKHAPVVKKAASMNFKATSSNAKSTENQAKSQPLAKAPVKRPTSLLPPKETLKSSKAPTRSTFELPGEAVALRLKEQREARLAQRESSEDSFHTARVVSGPKIRSTKPPTKPTFELPGEAVSRRKRAAHEARLKAQEEEERKRREFKAKPIRNSIVPSMVPRETVASRARQSRIGLENMEDGDLTGSKRFSNVGAHRPSITQLNIANVSAPRAKGTYATPTCKSNPTVHGPSMSGRATQRAVSATDVQVQRQRAKEIYNRDAKLAEDMEKEKKDRELAAKRARETAAERGRQASREWAERQLAKKIAEGDKGMSAGYGPGGQMGLKS